MMGDNQPTLCQLWMQEMDESISQMLWTQQTICVLMGSTTSESVAVRVLSKLILSFLTMVLTDQQICSHSCSCNSEDDLLVTTNGLILDSEEVSTLAEHLNLCCFYPNVPVNCIPPNAILRALCNLTDSSIVCCSSAKVLLLQNVSSDSEIALKQFLEFAIGTTKMRTAAFNLLWNLVEMNFENGTKTSEYVITLLCTHEREELAEYILGSIHEASPEGKNFIS